MKKIFTICFSLLCIFSLSGCSKDFSIDSATLKKWGDVFNDVSESYSRYTYIDGVYVAEKNNVHVELWDCDNSSDAKKWFSGNVETLKETAKTHVGSNTNSNGDYTITKDGKVYRIMFSDDKGIYSYANDKDSLNKALKELNIIEK